MITNHPPLLPPPPQSKNVVSVKGGCLEGLDWDKAIHIWTKSAMIPIPEGAESYSEDSEQTVYCASQEALDQPGFLTGGGAGPEAVAEERRRHRLAAEGRCEGPGPGLVWTGNASNC